MLKLLSLFSGIGAFEKALTNIDEPFEVVNYCEIDKYASKAYSLIHNLDENMNLGDITEIDTNTLPNDIDIVTYGFPCQDISNAGKGKGFVDESGELTRSGLFFQALRIIEDTKPKIAIAENVKALTGKKFTAEFKIVLDSLEDAGYKNYWAVLNAKDYGIPQNRERVFIISIRNDIDHGFVFPEKYELKLRLKDLLEDTVDEKYYLSDKMMKYLTDITEKNKARGNGNVYKPCDVEGVSKTITTKEGSRVKDNFIKVKNATKQGYIEGYEGDYVNLQFPNSNTRRGRVIEQCSGTLQCNDGNGVIVKEPQMLKVGSINSSQDGVVVSSEGISPTHTAGHNNTPKIVEDFYSNRDVPTYEDYCPTLRADRHGLKVIEPMALDEQNQYVRNDGCVGTLTTDGSSPKHNNRVVEIVTTRGSEIASTLRASMHKQGARNLIENVKNGLGCEGVMEYGEMLRIRKLTPKECFRLMGFDDEDIDILIDNKFSNTQLYKMAGNSIVVDVLEEIFVELLNQYEDVFPYVEGAVV